MKRKTALVLGFVLLLAMCVSPTGVAAKKQPFKFYLTNPSITPEGWFKDESCAPKRTTTQGRSNLWYVDVDKVIPTNPLGGGTWFNCYRRANYTKAGIGMFITTKQPVPGEWMEGYIPQNVYYTPVARLATNEHPQVEISGYFNCQGGQQFLP